MLNIILRNVLIISTTLTLSAVASANCSVANVLTGRPPELINSIVLPHSTHIRCDFVLLKIGN